MRSCRYILFTAAVFTVLVLQVQEAAAESAADLIEQGNRAFSEGRYDEALEYYEEASVEAPELEYVYFNKAASRYRKGDYKEALKLFEKAALKTGDLGFEAQSVLHQGNCLFREGERQRDSDLKKSLDALKGAVSHYQQARKLDPSLTDAAHNIEVSRLMIKQILDELKKKQEQAEKEQQKKQEQADALKKLIEKQENLAARTQDLKSKQPPDVRDLAQKLNKEQQELRSETEKLAEHMASSQAKPEDQSAAEAAEHLRSAGAEQSRASEKLGNADLDNAHDHQNRALEEMKKAMKQTGSPQSGRQKQTPEQKDQNGQKNQGTQNKEKQQKAKPLSAAARDIFDQEKEDRRNRKRRAEGGYVPVEKDW